jgi:hypothetical protein
VTAGFSLCELESAEARVEHVRKLWDLTRGYLVCCCTAHCTMFD